VAFTGRRAELGAALASRLGGGDAQEGGKVTLFIEADHGRQEDCARCVQATLDAFGRIDILFNNAGLVLLDRTAEQTSEDEWDQVMRLNVTVRSCSSASWGCGGWLSRGVRAFVLRAKASSPPMQGVWRMCKEVLPVMRKQGSGSIVNNASDWGLVGGRDAVAYCTSKGAVVLMTKYVGALPSGGRAMRAP
jgi:NAD(P)-dependent dehydrogenase (short-subunit alcohol dehydrogenase family)